MTTAPEIWSLPATRLAELVRRRQLSALEAATAALARLELVNPPVNAVVECRPEEVLSQARSIDAAIDRGEPQGPLAGVPVTVKINVDQRGYATTNGLKSQRDLIAIDNCPQVDNLLNAGAVLLGRSNVPAFSARLFTSNLLHGATLNPHDPTLTPGGSSGGAAAAVAVGIGAIAHGTDIAGSIRYPAYACGVHGLRPSLGRVAAFNKSAGKDRTIAGQIMAVSGPLARTVGDLRLGLHALAGRDVRDPWWTPAPLLGPEYQRKAAVCYRPDGMKVTDGIQRAMVGAADRLRDAGWQVDEVDKLPPFRQAASVLMTLWMADGSVDTLLKIAEEDGDPGGVMTFREQLKFCQALPDGAYVKALQDRATIIRDWNLFLERYAAVIIPPSATPPMRNDLDLESSETYWRLWQEDQLPSAAMPTTGLPVLAFCTGYETGVPTGVQIVSQRFREDICLDVGAAIESRSVPIAPVDPVSGSL